MSKIEMIMLLVVISTIIAITVLFTNSYQPCKTDVDWAIVYGTKVNDDKNPSAKLKARLDAAFDLYQQKKVKNIFVSGGIEERKKGNFDEALVMQNYLIQKGISKEDVTRDSKGSNTSLTSQNAFKLLGDKTRVVAVTQQFHISRSIMSLHHAGFQNVCGYFPDYFTFTDIFSVLRELPAWLKYWMFRL